MSEEIYSQGQLRQVRHCLASWKRIQELPARTFGQLDLEQLDTVELVAAADRFEAAGAAHLAIVALKKAVARPARGLGVNYPDVYRDLVAYHRQTGQYDSALAYQRQFIDYLSAETRYANSSDVDEWRAELEELARESRNPNPRERLLEDEPTLTGRYLGVPRELAEEVLGTAVDSPATRPGGTIDWHDYLEEIRVHLNHRMCSWATLSSLLVTGETLLVEGLLWTALTRPADVVVQELSDFARAFAALRLRRADTISPEIQHSYRAFVGLVQKLQDNVDLYRAIAERYFTGDYDLDRRPDDRIHWAAEAFDAAPLMARSLIAEAGVLLLTGASANGWSMPSTAPASVQPMVRVIASIARIAQRDNLLPLAAADEERETWRPYVDAEVPLRRPLVVPNLNEIVAKLYPQREPTRVRTVPGQSAPAPPKEAKRVKVGRNERCPCGSGQKFKKCCGR